jgi:transcriptional regulator with GAF, ATPase, and Fis domain
MIAPERLARVFVEMADTLVDEFDLIEFLEMVASRTSDLVNARAAGLLLADSRGRLQLMAASDERAELVELFQVQNLQGPCFDCYTTGEAVVNADLAQAGDRWPGFAPLAVSAGFRSVHAFPMRLRRQVLGALNLFGGEAGGLSTEDASVVQGLADIASIGLLNERAIRRGEVLTEQLQAALNSRIIIEQAKGALSQIHDENPDQAFNRLRDFCRRNHLRLGEVARDVVTDPDRVNDLVTPR